ncbi:MAG: hypothetical protein HJJLKODD_01836 [Phycisphaerae bacterium]|nr:hypothetical protein [Phycisphaerae bacterium]
MSEEKKPAAAKEAPKPAADAPAPFADKKRNMMTIIVVGVLMTVEGIGIVAAVKMFGGGPAETEAAAVGEHGEGGAEQLDEHGNPLPVESEVAVIDLMAYNNKSGYMYVFQINVQALIATEHLKKVTDQIESKKQTIRDRYSKIIRAADPKYFEEPGLETVKRQFKYELEQILNDKTLVKEILLPEFNQSRAD